MTATIETTNRTALGFKKGRPPMPTNPDDLKEKFFDFALDLTRWKHLDADIQDQLVWFHAYATEERLTKKQCEDGLAYDWNTIYRVFKAGDYAGSYENFAKKIISYRKLVENQGRVTTAYFVKNSIYEKVEWIFQYTLARKGCSMIVGEAGMGKTVCAQQVCKDNNHGRSVFIECVPIGGHNGLLRQLYAKATNSKKEVSSLQMFDAVVKSLNSTRIVVLDEFHLHLPDGKGIPRAIEMVRRIRDLSGCAMLFIATHRFDHEITKAQYMFEQFTGRTGKPFYLPKEYVAADVLPIVQQFIRKPGDEFMETILAMANDRPAGRLRHVVETFEFATAIAHDTNQVVGEKLFLAAKKLRDSKAMALPAAN